MTYSKHQPFFATLKTRERLSHAESEKSTQHIVLDIDPSLITYSVGDCLAICPSNSPDYVSELIERLNAPPEELVTNRKNEGPWSLLDFLSKEANLAQPTRALIELIHARHPSLLSEKLMTHPEELRTFLSEHDVLDILICFPCELPLQSFCHALSPLNPRYYSIASSQAHVSNEIHLTVVPVKYALKEKEKKGVCSRYICEIPLQTPVPVFIHPHRGFTLPENPDAPIIMIGPGTGIAPFRAFMQERLAKKHRGANWLFFGEWREKYDFFYKDFWTELVSTQQLKLTTAFSRDTEHKVYVHHKMREEAAEVFHWIESGAHLYVCGNAQMMAKDVEHTLLEIIQQEAQCELEEALAYIKRLRKDKRYRRDVY